VLAAIVLLLAGIAIGGGVALLWERRVRAKTAHGRGRQAAWRGVAVPIVGGALPVEALAVAARLGSAVGARVILVAIVQVPRTLSLEAESVPGLPRALDQLEQAEQQLHRLGAQVQSEVVRVREVGDFVERACAQAGAQLVVLESQPQSRSGRDLLRAFTEEKGAGGLDVLLTHHAAGSTSG
jgi:nucleotide-binding universal stress UspA family protein